MIDSLFQLFGVGMDGITTDVRTFVVGAISVLLIIIGVSVLMNVFNIGIGSGPKGGNGLFKNNDQDL
jgi:hypothetical protein